MPGHYYFDVRCHVCKALLRLTATRERAPRTRTPFKVLCPHCHEYVRGHVPLAVLPASIQVLWYERPAESG